MSKINLHGKHEYYVLRGLIKCEEAVVPNCEIIRFIDLYSENPRIAIFNSNNLTDKALDSTLMSIVDHLCNTGRLSVLSHVCAKFDLKYEKMDPVNSRDKKVSEAVDCFAHAIRGKRDDIMWYLLNKYDTGVQERYGMSYRFMQLTGEAGIRRWFSDMKMGVAQRVTIAPTADLLDIIAQINGDLGPKSAAKLH